MTCDVGSHSSFGTNRHALNPTRRPQWPALFETIPVHPGLQRRRTTPSLRPTHRHTFSHLDGQAGVVQELEVAGLLACGHHRLSQVRCAGTAQPVVVANDGSVSTCTGQRHGINKRVSQSACSEEVEEAPVIGGCRSRQRRPLPGTKCMAVHPVPQAHGSPAGNGRAAAHLPPGPPPAQP